MIYEAMLQVRDGGKVLFGGSLPPDVPTLNEKVMQVVDRKMEESGIVLKGFRLKVEAYEHGKAPDNSFKPIPEPKKKRIPTSLKREVCSMIERYFGAKGYRRERKSLRHRGPMHLRVTHRDKEQDGVERDWTVISNVMKDEFGWLPEVCWMGHHQESLLILTGKL